MDSRNDTLLIDSSKIEAAITKATKAILPVHLYGQARDMDVIVSIAKKYGLYIIEDCAQCHGAKWNGHLIGTWGTLAAFSFYPTKPLGVLGDAGAIVTNNDELADKVRMPYTEPLSTNVFHLFSLIVDNQKRFQEYMEICRIKTQVHYPIPPYMAP